MLLYRVGSWWCGIVALGRTTTECWGLPAFVAAWLRRMPFAASVCDRDRSNIVVACILLAACACVFGVMVPLMIADLTRGTGHFNVGQGIVGTPPGSALR